MNVNFVAIIYSLAYLVQKYGNWYHKYDIKASLK